MNELGSTGVTIDIKEGPQSLGRGQVVEKHPLVFIVHEVMQLTAAIDVEGQSVTRRCVALGNTSRPETFLVGQIWAGVAWQVADAELGRIVKSDSQAKSSAPFRGLTELHADFLAELDGLAAEDDAVAEVTRARGQGVVLRKNDS